VAQFSGKSLARQSTPVLCKFMNDLDAATHDVIVAKLEEQGFSHFP
jgi:hypothetical protein